MAAESCESVVMRVTAAEFQLSVRLTYTVVRNVMYCTIICSIRMIDIIL